LSRWRRAAIAGASALVLALAVGCGSDAEEEAAPVAPEIPSVPIASPGDVVRSGPDTPAAVRRALAGSRVIVIAFLVRAAVADDSVAVSLREVRGSPLARRGVAFFVFTIGKNSGFGDLPEVLAVMSISGRRP
jgi:hypothetical protein